MLSHRQGTQERATRLTVCVLLWKSVHTGQQNFEKFGGLFFSFRQLKTSFMSIAKCPGGCKNLKNSHRKHNYTEHCYDLGNITKIFFLVQEG